ncbi:Salivary lipocalin [Myotis brandtii]|uniref:Salivary lipocalin n=1 Tax=Myotis brandtii TaxID=109478 RepID=S7PE12_MYOBR|nr:Salivary lipocalin [Myotis brandtii]
MKLLLLCLGLTLVCAHDEGNPDVVTSNFDISKISGGWYTILLASDDKERIEENSVMRSFMESIQAWDDNSLTLKFHVKASMTKTQDTAVIVTLPIARKPDVIPKLKERFRKLCKKNGITKENILDATKVGKFSYFWFSLPKFPCYWVEKCKRR